MSAPPPVEIGSDFLGYRIEEVLGRGGMGVVYRAYDLRLKRTVALKLITPELALDERFTARFARETELAIALEHPNVVPIHDAGDVDGRLYLAMRLVEGTDLRALLATEGPLEPARALDICRQIANALDAAHARGLVHRDVKPSNVLLDVGEHVYLADFGLTRRLEEHGTQASEGRSVGTLAYVAPEQIEEANVDGRADQYSLGCVLYECLTGSVPHERNSRLAVAWAHLEDDPPAPSDRKSDLPRELDQVIRRALAKDPDERYPTCGAVTAGAEQALGLRQRPTLSRRALSLAVGATIAAAAIAVALAARWGTETETPAVRANAIVRIDPETNTISAVTDVGQEPMSAAAGGDSVWVYNRADDTVSKVDAETSEVRATLDVRAQPLDYSFLTGPVLAADADGAWVIGVDTRSRPVLSRVSAVDLRARNYRLDREPIAVAAGEGAVWVLARGEQDYQVLRVDPGRGKVTARTRFPASARLSSLSAGLGGVWAMSSPTAILYRIDPRSALVTGNVDLGERAGRPALEHGIIYVGLSDAGGTSLAVDPPSLAVVMRVICCDPLGDGYDEVEGHGSTWQHDPRTGTVNRFAFDPTSYRYRLEKAIAVTEPPRFNSGPCLTSIAATTDAVWVTLAHSGSAFGTCSR